MKYNDKEQFMLGGEEVNGKKILEKFEPEHVVVYQIDDDSALAFSDMGTDLYDIRKEFPDWTPDPGCYVDMYMMYKDDVLCVAGLEEFYDELEDFESDSIPITPDMNLCAHTPDEYVDFWRSNKEIPQDGTE